MYLIHSHAVCPVQPVRAAARHYDESDADPADGHPRATCQLHGECVSYHQLMFQVVENTVDLAAKDDMDFYLLLLQDVFQYMDSYQ
ncbi:MAG: hypothetical protein J6N15_00950 [Ruminiclostridium sp.]|nr:hypothetical protein [Ruminiclostridium sp.]